MKHALAVAVLASVPLVAGCASTGLSQYEAQGRTQSDYLYSLYDRGVGDTTTGKPAVVRLPTNVAVVQVGEVSPPQQMIDALREDPGVFARVESLPWSDEVVEKPRASWDRSSTPPDVHLSLTKLRRIAADAGMDYMLLVGGRIDHGTNATPLTAFDFTIIGAFIVPSRETRATGKGSASLIDVRTGRIAMSSTAEFRDSTLSPSVAVDGDETKLLEKVRDQVVKKLEAQVVADAKSRAATSASSARIQIPEESADAGITLR